MKLAAKLAIMYYSNRVKKLEKEKRTLKKVLEGKRLFGQLDIEELERINEELEMLEVKREKATAKRIYFERKL